MQSQVYLQSYLYGILRAGQKGIELKSLWYQVLSDVFHFESFDNVKSKQGPDL